MYQLLLCRTRRVARCMIVARWHGVLCGAAPCAAAVSGAGGGGRRRDSHSAGHGTRVGADSRRKAYIVNKAYAHANHAYAVSYLLLYLLY